MGSGKPIQENQFSPIPPSTAARAKLRILRAKPGRPVIGTIVSPDQLGTFKHYFGGRSSACDEERCEACAAGNARRWYAWLAILDARDEDRLVLLELTGAGSVELYEQRKTLDNLRGYTIQAERIGKRINGTLDVRILMRPRKLQGLPMSPDVAGILMHMWECGSKKSYASLEPVPPAIVRGSLNGQAFMPHAG